VQIFDKFWHPVKSMAELMSLGSKCLALIRNNAAMHIGVYGVASLFSFEQLAVGYGYPGPLLISASNDLTKKPRDPIR
jgi:hypothetical protein